jgi:hypothetical protein
MGLTAALFAGLVLMACPGPTRGVCDSTSCPDQQYCDVESRICVSAGGPIVNITSPLDGQALDGGTLLLTGKFYAGAQVESAMYQLGADAGWQPLVLTPQGTFSTVLSLPMLDRQTLPVSVRGASEAQEYSAQVFPLIDDVGTSAMSSPPEDEATPSAD